MTVRLNSNATGNLWLDRRAWFTLAINGQTLADMRLTQADLNALKEIYSKPYLEEKSYLAAIKAARAEMEAQSAVFVRAFLRLIDVVHLMRMPESVFPYKAYPRAKNTFESQFGKLFQLFPIQANDKVEVLIFAGDEVCPDLRFGPRPGAGTMAGEVGISTYPISAFEEGLSFVRVANNEPIYRFEQDNIFQLWNEASEKVRPHQSIKGRKYVPQEDVEPLAYQALPALFQQIYDVNPGDPIKS